MQDISREAVVDAVTACPSTGTGFLQLLSGEADRHGFYACLRLDLRVPVARPRIQAFSNVSVPDHSIEDISNAFRDAGFQVSASRFLANAFVPLNFSFFFRDLLQRADSLDSAG